MTPEQLDLVEARLRGRRPAADDSTGSPAGRAGGRRTVPSRVPLSSAQRRLWFLHRLDPDSPAYNVDYLWRVSGPLDVPAFGRAIDEIVRRHEALRTTFLDEDSEQYQIVHQPGPGLLSVADWSGRAPAAAAAEASALLDREAVRPYDLANGPLVRARLIRLGADLHLFLMLFHHIVADGSSMDVFWREMDVLYGAFRHGQGSPLAPPETSYADYATEQAAWLETPAAAEQTRYWTAALAGAPATLDLPTDFPRPRMLSGRGRRLDFTVPAQVTARLREIGRRHNASLFMVTQTAFDVLLSYYTGRTDIVTGSPIAGRTRPALEGMIGLCANEIPLRLRWTGDITFAALLDRLREVALESYGHQDLPFDRTVRALAAHRDLSHNPIFQVLFQGGREDQTPRLPGLRVEPIRGEANTLGFDLEMRLATDGAELAGSIRYSVDLFAEWNVRLFIEYFAQLLAAVAEAPDRTLAQLRPAAAPLPGAEPAGRSAMPAGRSAEPAVPRLIARTAAEHGSASAVLDDWTRIGYAELQDRIDRAAAGLAARGAGPGRTVVVALPFGADQLVAVPAVLTAGAACLPIEPDEAGRFPTMAAAGVDVDVDVVVTSARCRSDLADAGWAADPLLLDDLLRTAAATAPDRSRRGDLLIPDGGLRVVLDPPSLVAAVAGSAGRGRLLRALGELAAGRSVDVTTTGEPAVPAPLAGLGTVVAWLTVDEADHLRPAPGVRAAILDAVLRPVPVGMPGDLYAVGAGNGYAGRAATTAATWVADPAGTAGGRMLRTGLWARWRPDATIDVLARPDADVPRVVPDVQATLSALDEVGWAAAVQFPGDERPVGYVVPRVDAAAEPDRDRVVEQWGDVFDATYRGAPAAAPEADFAGWRSSYSGRRIPETEMREWRDGIVDLILARDPGRVLEIGVGTGLILSRVAPAATGYWGTDVSAAAIDRLRETLGDTGDRIRLLHQPAHDVTTLPAGGFDTVVLNSVVQYFPDAAYLSGVLDAARTLLAPHGRLIVGDVRNLRLLRHLTAEVGSDDWTGADLDLVVAHEEELLVDPGFFARYLRERPGDVAVDIRLKRARHRNEMSRYRFDVVLHVAPTRSLSLRSAPRSRWGGDVHSIADIEAQLGGERPAALRVVDIPNERIRPAADRLRRIDGIGERDRTAAPDVAALLETGGRLGYLALPTWAPDDPERIDLVLVDRGRIGDTALDGTYRGDGADPVANRPYVRPETSAVLSTIRERLAGRLPAGRLPSAILLLDRPPRRADGGVDLAALPRPQTADADAGPGDPREDVVRELFAEVLGRPQPGRHENFFEIGGHSLLAVRLMSRVRSSLGVDLSMDALFDAPTIAKLSALIGVTAAAASSALVPGRGDRATVPLSPAQRGLWLVQQIEGPSPTYNMPLAIRMAGVLDVDALHGALVDVVRRHEPLRTRFRETAAGPVTEIVPAGRVSLGLPVVAVEPDGLTGALTGAARHVFDLLAEIPVRTTLFVTGPERHALMLNIHHAAADGWSLQLICRDLGTAYAARLAGHPPDWSPLPLQYADYVLWQREALGDEDDPQSPIARQLAHWQTVLADLPDQLPLPADRARPARASNRGASVYAHLDRSLHAEIARFAGASDATVFMVMQAAFAVLLSRLGAGTDIPISTAVGGRTERAVEDLVGFFVNTLVLRTDTSGDPPFRELVARVRRTDMAAFANQDLPFSRLVQSLNPTRSLAYHPLAQVALNFESNAGMAIDLPGLSVEIDDTTELGGAKVDLNIYLRESRTAEGRAAGIEIGIDYSTDLFEATTARRLAAQLEQTVRAGLAQPDRPVSELTVLDAETRRTLLVDWNNTARPVPPAVLPTLFEAQVRRTPGAVALIAERPERTDAGLTDAELTYTELTYTELTYAELNGRANRLARCLVGAGLGAEDIVAVALPRSVELVVTILGIAKAGAAYLPVDPDYPADRIRFMLSDSCAAGLLTTPPVAARLPETTLPRMDLVDDGAAVVFHDAGGAARRQSLGTLAVDDLGDGDRRAPLLPAHPAYAIYTSGSTGRPSRVLVTHTGIASLADAQIEGYRCGPGSRMLQFASPSFDAAFSEVSTALLSGATVVVADPDEMAPGPPLAALTRRLGVTSLMLPPSALAVMAPADLGTGLSIVAAGEALPGHVARRWSASHHLVNAYGPTETTVCATMSRRPFPGDGPPTIGTPLTNVAGYVLDPRLQLVPPGVVGELYVAGPGLARGYGDQPALTARRFVANPFRSDGSRMYRTGDLVRRDNSGELYFAGRVDHQVKIRGYRVELGEIERALAGDPAVGQAVAVARGAAVAQTDDQLVAYVVPAGAARPDPVALRRRLIETLPAHLVPAQVVVLDSMPLTPNGKVDRSALASPEPVTAPAASRPADPIEEMLCDLFAEVLGLERFGLDDNFFDAGGHSLRATQLIRKIRRTFECELSVRALFEAPTPAHLARRLVDAPAPARPRHQHAEGQS